MKNQISDLAPKRKTLLQKVKDYWQQKEVTEQEIRVHKMMLVLFDDQTTEQVIDTLMLFEEKAKARLKEIKQQAETDKFVTDFYLGTNERKTIKI